MIRFVEIWLKFPFIFISTDLNKGKGHEDKCDFKYMQRALACFLYIHKHTLQKYYYLN